MRRKRRRYWLWIVFAIVAAGAILAYSYLTPEAEEVTYLTQDVAYGNIRKTVNTTGQIGPVQLVDVGAQASGQIVRLYVQLGQTVRKGDLIAEIDNTSQTNDLETSRSRLETYRAQLESRLTALSVAQSAYDRELQLRRSDSTSRTSLENAQNTLAQAQASVTELESTIKQTEIAVRDAETNLGYARITAPLDGTVVAMIIEEGQTVNANMSTPTIAQIADLTKMEIKLEIAEGDITKVAPGMPVEYTILSEPGVVYQTELASIDPGLNTMSDGNYSSSVSNSNAIYYYGKCIVDNLDGKLRIGMTTTNSIIVASEQNVLTVPNLAVNNYEGRTFVQVLHENDEIESRVVMVGVADTMNTHVISGLNAGDKVITTRMGRVDLAAAMGGGFGPGNRPMGGSGQAVPATPPPSGDGSSGGAPSGSNASGGSADGNGGGTMPIRR